jgi:amidophosphoribosyltransferase
MIAGYGLLAFRDPYGIRPLVIGRNETAEGTEYMVASESVALDTLGFKMLRDVEPGEAVLIDMRGNFVSRQCAERTLHAPCMFEFVYLARPDSVMDGISVYETRVKMGELPGREDPPHHAAPGDRRGDPDSRFQPALGDGTGRAAQPPLSRRLRQEPLHRPHLHHARPGDAPEIGAPEAQCHQPGVQGARACCWSTTPSCAARPASEIVMMAREAGAKKVYFASASPPVRFANVYGIDMPTRSELIAAYRSDEEICREIGADALIYQDLDALKAAVRAVNPTVTQFETSCFDGNYITGDVTSEYYLQSMEDKRSAPPSPKPEDHDGFDGPDGEQLDLNLVQAG